MENLILNFILEVCVLSKESFLDIIRGTSPEQLRDFINKNGKDPKLINPIIMTSETRYDIEEMKKSNGE